MGTAGAVTALAVAVGVVARLLVIHRVVVTGGMHVTPMVAHLRARGRRRRLHGQHMVQGCQHQGDHQ